MYKAIDDAMVAHRDDIAIMNNRQKLLSQEPPQFHPDEVRGCRLRGWGEEGGRRRGSRRGQKGGGGSRRS